MLGLTSILQTRQTDGPGKEENDVPVFRRGRFCAATKACASFRWRFFLSPRRREHAQNRNSYNVFF